MTPLIFWASVAGSVVVAGWALTMTVSGVVGAALKARHFIFARIE